MTGTRWRFKALATGLLGATMLASGTLAHAQEPAAPTPASTLDSDSDAITSAEEGREITVTGSRIRGVAPTGSAVIGLNSEEIQRLPVATTTDILRQLPIVTSLGADEGTAQAGSAVQGGSFNNTAARAANLRGFGTAATLVLIDGHRLAPQGVSGQISDLDVIPALAVSSVEVVADGASAIYGSDAVAGVINIILKKRWDGARVMGRYGFADDYHQTMAGASVGRTWGTGAITATYEYSYRSRLSAADRPALYSNDLSPYGGSAPSAISAPGNVLIGGSTYAVPSSSTGQNFTLANLGPKGVPNLLNAWRGLDALPQQERHSALIYAEQDIGDRVKLIAEGIYTRRTFERRAAAAAGSATGYAVPSSNPFSPCAPGKSTANSQGIVCPANGTVNVQYSFLNDLGPTVSYGVSELWSTRAGAEVEMFGDWKAAMAGGFSRAVDNSNTANTVNTTAVTAAIAGTATLTRNGVAQTVTKPASVPFLNLFCGDIANCNSQATLDYIRGETLRPAKNELLYGTLGLDGSLLRLPGGAVRAAIGADVRRETLENNNIQNTVTATNAEYVENPTRGRRDVTAFYGELFVPIFGADNATPGFQRLALSLALRTEKYSDFGRTTNPKFGLSWQPFDGINLRGSYGKSFRAPRLADIDPSTAAVFRATALTSAQAAGIGLPAVSTLSFVSTTGGTPGLEPEKATTWSLGADIRPTFAPGFELILNYYNVRYSNRIDQPVQNAGTLVSLQSSPLYDDFIIYNPAFFPSRATLSQAAFNAAVQAIYDSKTPVFTGNTAPIASVVAITQGNKFNAGNLKTDGLDFSASYIFDAGSGRVRLGYAGTYVFKFVNQITPNATPVDLVNQFSAVGAPLRFRSRGEISWIGDNLSVSTYLNHTNPYRISRNQIPATAPDKYLRIRGRLTVDATVNYRFPGEGMLGGLGLQLSAQNILDDKPPFMINNGTVPVLFDPTNASPLGRLVSLQVTKDF